MALQIKAYCRTAIPLPRTMVTDIQTMRDFVKAVFVSHSYQKHEYN